MSITNSKDNEARMTDGANNKCYIYCCRNLQETYWYEIDEPKRVEEVEGISRSVSTSFS